MGTNNAITLFQNAKTFYLSENLNFYSSVQRTFYLTEYFFTLSPLPITIMCMQKQVKFPISLALKERTVIRIALFRKQVHATVHGPSLGYD